VTPLQVIKLDHDFGTAVSGVLTDNQARVLALWGSYSEQAGTPCRCTSADRPHVICHATSVDAFSSSLIVYAMQFDSCLHVCHAVNVVVVVG
jgi:hypothetical protein